MKTGQVTPELDRFAEHPLIRHFIRSLKERPGKSAVTDVAVRLAAILLVLRARADGEPELLMIKRAEHESDPWSGHIACPGGRMDPGDRDLEMTALRETWEETGIDVARDGRVLGHLDDLVPQSPLLPPLVIRPYVALVIAGVEAVPSPEVASAFWVPLSALGEKAAWGMGLVEMRGARRRVSQFQHGEHIVWGLTERALRQFLEYMGCGVDGDSIDEAHS